MFVGDFRLLGIILHPGDRDKNRICIWNDDTDFIPRNCLHGMLSGNQIVQKIYFVIW